MCGHLNGSDWLKLALLAAGATATGGALLPAEAAATGGMAAGEGLGMLGAGEAGAAFPGLGLGAELGAGAGAGGLAGTDEIGAGAGGRGLLGQAQDLAGKYGPQAQKFAKAYGMAQQSGLLGGGQQRMPMPNPPGGGPQMAGMPSSAQIAFPDAYQPKAPYYPLDEALRKRMQDMGY